MEKIDLQKFAQDPSIRVIVLTTDAPGHLIQLLKPHEETHRVLLNLGDGVHPRYHKKLAHNIVRDSSRVPHIISTHSPLILAGFAPSPNVCYLRFMIEGLGESWEEDESVLEQLSAPLGLTAEQILTGAWFGLSSTLDDDTLELLEQHRKLLREGSVADAQARFTARRNIEETLRQRLSRFAETSVEELVLSVVAELEDSTPFQELSHSQIRQLRETVINNIRSPLTPSPQEKKNDNDNEGPLKVFEAYRKAVSGRDGLAACKLVDRKTIQHFAEYRDNLPPGLRSSTGYLDLGTALARFDWFGKLLLLRLRHEKVDPLHMTGESLFAISIERGYVSNTVRELEISQVHIDGNHATLSAHQYNLELVQEDGQWKLSLWKFFSQAEPVMQKLFAESGAADEISWLLSIEKITPKTGNPV